MPKRSFKPLFKNKKRGKDEPQNGKRKHLFNKEEPSKKKYKPQTDEK
jgi:hypothetical protein